MDTLAESIGLVHGLHRRLDGGQFESGQWLAAKVQPGEGIGDTIGLMPNAKEILDQYFLEMRWRCLSLAADLDRVQRAGNGPEVLKNDPRLANLKKALAMISEEGAAADRAERVQRIFTDHTPPPAYGKKA
jgi:hypothetical protein